MVADQWGVYDCPAEMRWKMTNDVLRLWQHAGCDELAVEYIEWINRAVAKNGKDRTFRQVLETEICQIIRDGDIQVLRVRDPDGLVIEEYEGYIDKHGKYIKHGWNTHYDESGQPILVEHFRDGKKVGGYRRH